MRFILFLIILLFPAKVLAVRLLVKDLNGDVKMVQVHITGSDTREILWDERVDGKFPNSLLTNKRYRGVSRINGSLVFDEARFNTRKVKEDAKILAEATKKTKRNQWVQAFRDGTATNAQIQKAILRLLAGD